MFKNTKNEELEGVVETLIPKLPEDTLKDFISNFMNRPYDRCPSYIQKMFLFLHKFHENFQSSSICYIKRSEREPHNPTEVSIGIISNTLNQILENYTLDKEGKGKLILSCPNCQTVFPLTCTFEENYEIVCSNCGKNLNLTVKSNEIKIKVKGK